ncbi:septum formation family protein [Streptomyces sp. NPDC051738]|uniref:septum formation family protein n=1 Tax=Streptomyces sp. NPDC051738 TaxID=3365672 RepID=UPI0037D3B388
MGSPDVPGQGEPPDPEPPYRPWPGEQLPYTPSTASPGDFSEPVQPPRRRHAWLRAAALLVAVAGISTGAALFTQSDDDGPTGDVSGIGIETTVDEPTPPDDTSPSEPEPEPETEPETEPEETYVDDLSVGDCVDATESNAFVLIVPCDGQHDMQTLAVTELEDSYEYPGGDWVDEEAETLCYEAYSDVAENWTVEEEDALMWDKVVPDPESWESGDRTVVCFLESLDEEPLEEDWLAYSFY